MKQDHHNNISPPQHTDPLAGLSAVELLRSAGEPMVFQGTAPAIEGIAAAFPRLEILALLGQGGMGYVYTARQPDLDRVVALKILRPELSLDPAFAERFSREARVLAKLNHPNIVHVFEHGQAGHYFYLLMEHVDGVNLRQAMKAGRFTPEQALAIVPGICDALQAAHTQGIWHRDIKPENILLDQEGQVKIVDFGIARIIGDPARDFTLTRTGAALGSAPYMAPEQHERPHDVDHRADIYSLGVVFYEMLTGELPLGRFPIPSERAAVHARIDDIVLQTLEKERELRQQTANEVKTDIQRAARESGTAMEEKTTAPAASRVGTWFAGLSALVRWSLVCWPTGLILLAIGFLLDKQRISGAAFPLALGALASGIGILGGLWSLFEMRRGWMPENGRRVLTWFFLFPLLVGAGYLGACAGIFSLIPKGNGQLNYLYGVPISLAGTLVLAWPLRHFLHSGFLRTRGTIISACLLLALTLIAGKFLANDWPFNGQRLEVVTLRNEKGTNPTYAAFLGKFRQATGQQTANFTIKTVADFSLEIRFFTDPKHRAFDRSLMPAIVDRLNQFTPPNEGKYTLREYYWMAPYDDTNVTIVLFLMAGTAAIAALLVCGCGLRTCSSLLTATAIATCIAVYAPASKPAPPALRLSPQMPFTPEQLPREVDFTTPEATALTIILAAHRGQKDIMRDSVTPQLAEMLETTGTWDFFCQNGEAVDIAHQGKPFLRDASAKRAVSVIRTSNEAYVLVNGMWKLDQPKGAAKAQPAPKAVAPLSQPEKPKIIAPKEDPIATVRSLNRWANEQNAEAFLARRYRSYISFGGNIPAAQSFAPYYGEILKIVMLPSKDATEAQVVAKFKRPNGTEDFRLFDLRMDQNEWYWLSSSPPKYRTWITVKFSPPQDNGVAILKNHLGDKPFHQFAGTDVFLIGGESYDATDALADAENQHRCLFESLKQAGLSQHLTIITPATKPSEPWMGETVPAVSPTPDP